MSKMKDVSKEELYDQLEECIKVLEMTGNYDTADHMFNMARDCIERFKSLVTDSDGEDEYVPQATSAEGLIKRHYNDLRNDSLIPAEEISDEIKEEIFKFSDWNALSCQWVNSVPGYDKDKSFLHVFDIKKVYR